MFTLQPEEIQYVLSSVSPEKIAPEDEDDEGTHKNRVDITLENGTRFIYLNLPFSITKNNQQITALDIRVQDLINSMGGAKNDKFHDVVLRYFAIKKSQIPKIGTRIDVEIETPVEVAFGSIVEHPTLYKKFSLKGNFAVKEVSYESTIVGGTDPTYAADITLTRFFAYDEEGDPIEEQKDAEEVILTILNPIDKFIQVQVSLQSFGEWNYVFDGLLVDINTSSARAMGFEALLAETQLRETFVLGTQIKDFVDGILGEPILHKNLRPFVVNYGTHNHFGELTSDVSFVREDIWSVISGVANNYKCFLTVEYGSPSTIHMYPEQKEGNRVIISGSIPKKLIEERDVKFRGLRTYTGIEISGTGIKSNKLKQKELRITVHNKMYEMGEGVNFQTHDIQATDEASSDTSSFYVKTPEDFSGISLSASATKYDYIPSTFAGYGGEHQLPEDPMESYFTSVEITINPDFVYTGSSYLYAYPSIKAGVVYNTPPQVGQEELWVNAHARYLLTKPGKFVVDFFGDEDNMTSCIIVLTVHTPIEDTDSTEDYLYELPNAMSPKHLLSASLRYSVINLDEFAHYYLTKENAKLQDISMNLNGYIEAKPGDAFGYEYHQGIQEYIIIENYSFSYEKNREITTKITGYSYDWPIGAV